MVQVHNGGPPIPMALLPSLFLPFHQGAASREGGGCSGSLGLGLFIVRETVEAHGGAVRVESTAERGTTFTVELPRAGARPQCGYAAGAPAARR
jgi:signal transduction histidine kinase